MKSQRTIIFISGLMLALAVAWPAPTLASSLLSGYGGPGQGNQAILGSALVNGSRGGGGAGGGGAGGSGGSSAASSGSEGSAASEDGSSSSGSSTQGTGSGTTSTSSGASASGSGASGSHSGSGSRSAGAGRSGAGTAAAATASFYPASERIAAGQDAGTLGLSGADLLYILLAIGTLLFTGVLTTRLGRSSAAGRASG